MDYDVNGVVCDAEESDWLDISYSERKYVNKPQKQHKHRGVKLHLNTTAKALIIAVLCVALLATMLFIDGDFSKQVFQTAKQAYSSVLPAFSKNSQKAETNKVEIPCNINLVSVEDGVATFNGGKAAVSFTAGKVSEVTENKVVVEIDEKTSICYDNLLAVFVKAGDVVSANSLLGKYRGQFTATIVNEGGAVKEVVGSSTELTWNV